MQENALQNFLQYLPEQTFLLGGELWVLWSQGVHDGGNFLSHVKNLQHNVIRRKQDLEHFMCVKGKSMFLETQQVKQHNLELLHNRDNCGTLITNNLHKPNLAMVSSSWNAFTWASSSLTRVNTALQPSLMSAQQNRIDAISPASLSSCFLLWWRFNAVRLVNVCSHSSHTKPEGKSIQNPRWERRTSIVQYSTSQEKKFVSY